MPFCRLDIPTKVSAFKRINIDDHSNARSAGPGMCLIQTYYLRDRVLTVSIVQFNPHHDNYQSALEPSSSLTLVQNFAVETNVLVNAPNVNPLAAGM